VEGASALPLALPPQAPSTTLRVVPLPQFVSLRGGGCSFVIARSNATKQSSFPRKLWIASLPLAMTHETSLSRRLRVRVRRTTTQNTPQQKGRRSAERRMPTTSAQQRRMSPFADAFRAAARRSRGRARLPALHRGTHQRLLPRWLSPRTGFPQSTAKRVFCPPAAQRFELSTLRADRSFCRPHSSLPWRKLRTLVCAAPGPPGSGSHQSARGRRIPLRFPKVPSRKAPLVSESVTQCIQTRDKNQVFRPRINDKKGNGSENTL
jgi:hypothetical protein